MIFMIYSKNYREQSIYKFIIIYKQNKAIKDDDGDKLIQLYVDQILKLYLKFLGYLTPFHFIYVYLTTKLHIFSMFEIKLSLRDYIHFIASPLGVWVKCNIRYHTFNQSIIVTFLHPEGSTLLSEERCYSCSSCLCGELPSFLP